MKYVIIVMLLFTANTMSGQLSKLTGANVFILPAGEVNEKPNNANETLDDWAYDTLISEATKCISRAVALDENTNKHHEVTDWINLGIALFNKAIEREPMRGYSYSWMGVACWTAKDFTTALTYYKRASLLDPELFKNFERKADCKRILHDYAGAVLDYTTALNKITPDKYSLYYRLYADRAYCYWRLKEYKKSIQDYDIAIALNNNKSEFYYLRGRARLGLDRISSACLDFKKASELGNDSSGDLIKKHCNP
jgi:tetratricopeptide (TPR) repeat protein